MSGLRHESPFDQPCRNGNNQNYRDNFYCFPVQLSGFILKLRKQIGQKQYHDDDYDHDGWQSIDRRIDTLCHIIYNNRDILYTISWYEIGNNEIIKWHGKCKQRACENTLFDHRHDNLCQSLKRCCPKVHGSICHIRIQSPYLRINAGNYIRGTECNMCQQHSQIPFSKSQRREQQHQTDGSYDLRIQNRDIINIQKQFLDYLLWFG